MKVLDFLISNELLLATLLFAIFSLGYSALFKRLIKSRNKELKELKEMERKETGFREEVLGNLKVTDWESAAQKTRELQAEKEVAYADLKQ